MVTIHDIAVARGLTTDEEGGFNGQQYLDLGLPFIGGCEICHACIAAYNACPSKSGYLRCQSGCIGSIGFETVAEFEAWCEARDVECNS